MIYLIWAVVLIICIVLYIKDTYAFFDKFGVKYIKPMPLLGNMWGVLSRKVHMGEDLQMQYDAFPDERFSGKYEFMMSLIVIHDLDLIKQITIKDFEYFLDRPDIVDETMEPCFGRSLMSLKGQEWKDMRSTLSPAFTSSKMRNMIPFMLEVNEQMLKVVKKKIKESPDGYADFDITDLTTRHANDVIASCAFGVKLDSHSEENIFYTMSKGIATFGFKAILVVIGYRVFPTLMKKFKVRLFTTKTTEFFSNMVIKNMQEREVKNILRPDMIHLLMEAKKGKLTHEEKTQTGETGFSTVEESDYGTNKVQQEWTDNDLIAQAVIFLLAGYETVSTTMTFIMYEMARHPEVQERLYQEIKENDVNNNGKFDYNSIQKLKYLDMVISEVLRLWPPVVGLSRKCLKDYNIGKANDKAPRDYIIRAGEGLILPVWPIHHDARYYPEPNKFDPERFSDENKGNIKPLSYMPFGSGPRNCIGSRFALSEVKVMAYQMILQLELSPCEKTTIPPKLNRNTFNVKLQGGCWLRIKMRQ